MMAEELTVKLEQFLRDRPYHALFLLVHPDIQRLNDAADTLDRHYNWPRLSVSADLSQVLYDLPPQQRPSRIPHLLTDRICTYASGPLLCTDIPLLFEPDWQIDPLRLFLETSKNATLIILWPGTYHNDSLTYAVPMHAHYRVWPMADLAGQAFQLAP
jgi:hypothetical protein